MKPLVDWLVHNRGAGETTWEEFQREMSIDITSLVEPLASASDNRENLLDWFRQQVESPQEDWLRWLQEPHRLGELLAASETHQLVVPLDDPRASPWFEPE